MEQQLLDLVCNHGLNKVVGQLSEIMYTRTGEKLAKKGNRQLADKFYKAAIELEVLAESLDI
jgi:hypothetical protein